MKYFDFLNEIVNDENAKAEWKEVAAKEMEKYQKAQLTRKAYTEKKNAEKNVTRNANREKLMGVLTNEPKTATTLIEESGLEISRQAIAPLLKPLVEDGTVTKELIAVDGIKGKQVGYKLS